MKLPKRPVLAVLAALVLAMLAALLWWSQQQAASDSTAAMAAAPQRPALTVTVARPQQAELALKLSANGNVAAWQEASVGAETNGLRLTEVRMNVGDVVKRGQVLAVFSGEQVLADVAQAKAALAEAEATASNAAGNAERARTLEKTGALSQQQINQYSTAAHTAQARLEAARAMLAAQQVRGRNLQVLAPDDGVISAREATVGAVVGSGTELFRLIRQGRLEWRAEVTAEELARIAVGTPALVLSASGEPIKGRVRQVAPTVDAKTRNALVYVDLPGALRASSLKAGMFARGEFELGRSNGQTLPQGAIVPRDGFNYVLMLQAQNRVTQFKVQTGRRVGDQVEILTPLPPDSQVVVEGAGFLSDGDLVRVVDAATATQQESK